MSRTAFSTTFVIAALIAPLLFVAPTSLTQRSDHKPSRLLKSYGHPQPSCELEAALDLLAETLAEDVTSTAHIIVYRGSNNPTSFFHSWNPPGLFQRHSLGVRSYLSRAKNLPMERIVIVDGGLREQFQADMWIVADGEKPPAASPDTTLQIREDNGLFDEYICNSDSDLAEYFDSSVRLTGFSKALSNEPNARGYIVGYAQCLDITETNRVSKDGKDEYVSRQYKQCDPAGTGGRIGRIEKRSLLKLSGMPQSRIAVIDGGYRNAQMVELWVMPSGAESPKPTPTADPRKRK